MSNVFRFCSKKNVFKKIGLFFRRIKWAWQRATKGYCDMDYSEIDSWFLSVIPDMLKEFVNLEMHGLPDTVITDYYNKHQDEYSVTIDELFGCGFNDKKKESECQEIFHKAQEEYDKELNRIAFLFKESDPFGECEVFGEEEQIQFEEIDNYKEKCKNEAFELFSKHFNGIWV
ncbi:MAG: hypothetical protein J6Y43_00560 [Clostridia bacterium]|nr:hypothetical protein [Clostridia bacterium]